MAATVKAFHITASFQGFIVAERYYNADTFSCYEIAHLMKEGLDIGNEVYLKVDHIDFRVVYFNDEMLLIG